MAEQKTEAILITKKRDFVQPRLEIEGRQILWSKNIRYLGVLLDNRMSFARHLNTTAEKATKTAVMLARLMLNIKGPSECKRKLLSTVISAKMLYAAPIWEDAMKVRGLTRKLNSMQRINAIRIVSAYRTVSESAVLVLASLPPIDLLAKERREVYEIIKKVNDDEDKRECKKQARQRLLQT